MNCDINDKLNDIIIEDHIWIIYVLIIIASWYSNNLERKYFIYNDLKSREGYQKILVLIFSVLLIVYLYFFKSSFDSIHKLTNNDSYSKRKLTELASIGSLLIVISGVIFLYVAYSDTDIDVELAFN